MKKTPIIIIIVAIILLSIGGVLLFSNGKGSSTNKVDPGKEKKKKEPTNLPPYEKEELYGVLDKWAQDMYFNKDYDKCVKKDDGTCFLSLSALEIEYGKDVTMFKGDRGQCLMDTSGITFYLNDSKTPFSIALEGCAFLDYEEEPEPPDLSE